MRCNALGFGPHAVAPTRAALLNLRRTGTLPNVLIAYAGREDFADAGNHSVPWPLQGQPPKYWVDSYARAEASYVFLARNEDGNYVARPFKLDDMLVDKPGTTESTQFISSFFSASGISFYRAHPSILAPRFVVKTLSVAEQRRLSFPEEEVADPLDYPVGIMNPLGDPYVGSTWNGDWIIYIENGVPYFEHLNEANLRFPLDWTPRETYVPAPGAVDIAAVVAAIDKLCKTSAARLAVYTILSNTALTADEKLRQVLAALK